MIDITSFNETTNDLNVLDTQAPRAGNILGIQLGSLEYAKDIGIDLAYFLSDNFRFQNESFRAYIIEILAQKGINVASVDEVVDSLFVDLSINLSPDENSTALIAR